MVVVDKILYGIGIDLPTLKTELDRAESAVKDFGKLASDVFGKQIAREMARGIDSKAPKHEIDEIRNHLKGFGDDAIKIFDHALGQKRAKAIFSDLKAEAKRAEQEVNEMARRAQASARDAARTAEREMREAQKRAQASARDAARMAEREMREAQKRAQASARDAARTAEREMREAARAARPSFSSQLKEGLRGGFDIKSIALGSAAGIGLVGIASGLKDVATQIIAVGRDATETRAKFNEVFGGLSDSTRSWANTFADSVGRARIDTENFLASFQGLIEPMGFTNDQAAEFSKTLVTLATDVASFNNQLDADVVRDFQSALTGESEPVKKYGIIINETRVKQEALNMGIIKAGEALTEQQKVQVRYNILLKDTAAAQGDAIRTADSLANQQKRLEANWKNMADKISAVIVPALADMTSGFNEFFSSLGRSDLEDTIASLRKLGVESERLKFLEMRSAAENAKEEIASLEQQFNVLTNNISTFGKSSGIPLLDTRAYREGAKDIADTFQQIITSTQGATLAQQRLIELDKEFAQVELRITEAKQGREQLSKGELQSLNEQREYLIGQRETLVDLLGVGAKIAVQKEIIKKSEDEISGKNKEQTQQAEQTAAAVVQVAAAERAVTAEKKKQVDAVLKIRNSVSGPLPGIRDSANSLDVKLVLKPIEYDFEAVRAKIAQERRDARDHAMQLFGEIAGTFDDFLVQMDRTGIRVNRTLLDLSALIYDGVNGFLPAFTKFKDVLGNTDAKFLDKFAAGFSAVSIGAGIALPLMKGFLEGFGLFGKRSQEMLRIDEIQRESMEKQREAAEAMRKSIEEMRQSLRDASLERINAQLRETEEQIRAITGGIVDLSVADIARVEKLTGIVAELERQISEAEDRGDLDLAGRLREDLAPFLEELDRFGFRTSNFTAAQLENLKLLAEKSDELRKALEGFGGFADNFGGMMEKLRAQFELFDIEDVTEKFKLFGEEMKKRFGVDLPVSMEGIDEFVRKGFEAFEQGGEALAAFLTSMGLGDMSAGTFWEFLSTLEQFGDEMGKEGDRLDDTTDEIVDKFSKLMSRLELEFDLFNVDDPVEQFRRMREDIFAQFNAVIPMTEEGIAAFIKAGFTALGQGEDAVKALLAQLDLEELTADTFQDLLRRLAGYAREAKKVIDDVKEDSREERVTGIVRQITFTEANELIDEVSTIREVVTQMLDLARDPAHNPMAGHYDLMGDYLTENNLLARQQLTELIQIKLAVRQLVQAPSAASGGATNVLLFGGTNSAQAPAGSLSPQELAKYRDSVSRAHGRGIV